MKQRVLAYVTRERGGRKELLVFDHRDHPDAGTQVPAGRVDEGETLEECLRRELREETGLDDVVIVREVPVAGDWVTRSRYENHVFEVCLRTEPPDSFEHVVQGDGDDAGLVFDYRWARLDSDIELFGGDDLTFRGL